MFSLSDSEFAQFQRFIYQSAGITLSDAKRALVCGRLAKRLHACQLKTYGEYLDLLRGGQSPAELQMAVDLLTTNETYFFREPKHFEFLKRTLRNRRAPGAAFRVWSAAGSTGEEAYSIAMVLDECLGSGPWDVVASDISARVLARARTGHYPLDRLSNFPRGYLQRYCLKGTGAQEGTLLVERKLRSRVRFLQVNLNARLPRLGTFDIIFLRNVLIYFNLETKRGVVARLLDALKPGGWLLIGHSETLIDVSDGVEMVSPAIYRKPQ
jgi:chemotaxis protein methyltransferase CheR